MNRNTKSLMIGAATAALLIVPTLGSVDTAFAAHVAQPAAPATPPAPPAAPAPPPAPGGWRAADNSWTRWPVRSYAASNVKFDDIVGTVIVDVRDGGQMTVEVSGAKSRVAGISVAVKGNTLQVDGSENRNDTSVWNWHDWFNFSNLEDDRRSDNLFVKVTVPRGTDVNIDGLVGNADIGDTQAALRLEAAVTNAKIGKVSSAKIDLGGDGRIDIASVTGDLDLDIGGSGKVNVGSTGSVRADIAGSGDAEFGAIAGGLKLEIAGSGDVKAARVNGPVRIEIAGSGNVRIGDGVADPLHIEMMGAGDFAFGGVAVDPHIEAFGSGTVRLKSYRGHLDTEGMADVKIGD
jgi:Putative auto-transporter adhesin, head GIN domain